MQDSWSKYADRARDPGPPRSAAPATRSHASMRVAVLSDVHANCARSRPCWRRSDAGGFDEIWCLGDSVGYGPKPNECAALLQERAAICLAGNHDLVVLGKIADRSPFAGEAAAAARWTQTVLDDDRARVPRHRSSPEAVAPGVELFHGSPRDPVWDYVLSRGRARDRVALTEAPLVLVGHSHVALEIIGDGGELRGDPAPAGRGSSSAGCGGCSTRARSASRATATRGPRGSRLTSGRRRATFRRTDYPVERTQAEMREAGLPEALALRLAFGI